MLVDRILKVTDRIWKVADSTRNVTDRAIKVKDSFTWVDKTLKGWIEHCKL